jgi:hypothetical protein
VFKKIAIGCAILFVLLAVGGGIATYWVYSKAKSYLGSISELGDTASIEAQVSNNASFDAPANGELTDTQVQRFVALNEQAQSTLGPKFEALKKRYDELEAKRQSEGGDPSPAEVFDAIKDLTGVVKDVRTAQVSALNAQGMSLDEYRWVRDRVYEAAGIPISISNIGAFVDAAKSGNLEAMTKNGTDATGGSFDVPEKNKELVTPIQKKLEEWAALAWLGF